MKFGMIKRGEAVQTGEWIIDIGFREAFEYYRSPAKAWRFRFMIEKYKPAEQTFTLGMNRKGIRWQSRIIWHPLSWLRMWLERRGY